MARAFATAGDFVYLTGPWRDDDARLPAFPPRCLYLPTPGGWDYYTDQLLVDPEWLVRTFSRRHGTDPIDGVVTSKVAFVPMLQALLSDSLRCDDVPVYGFEAAVQDEEFGTTFRGRSLVTMRALGYSMGYPIFLTDHELERATRLARRHLPPWRIAELQRRYLLTPPGLDFDALDRVRAGATRPNAREQFVLFSGARINALKQSTRIAALYDALYQANVPARVVITTPTGQMMAVQRWGAVGAALRSRPGVVTKFSCTRDEYLAEAAQAHAFVVWSKTESAPTGYVEQLYLGLVGLFHRARWSEAFLPPDYPWFFSTVGEAAGLLRRVASDYPSAAEWNERHRAALRARYAISDTWVRLRTHLATCLADGRHAMPTRGLMELVETALPLLPETFSFTEMMGMIGRVSRTFKPSLSSPAWWREPTRFDLYRLLIDRYGCVDACDARIPAFTRQAAAATA